VRLSRLAAKASAVTYNQSIVHPAPGVLVKKKNVLLSGRPRNLNFAMKIPLSAQASGYEVLAAF